MKRDEIESVRREVLAAEQDGKPARTLLVERSYDTDVQDLWEALTDAERIPRWLLPVEGELRLGGRYRLKDNAEGTVTGCEPPDHLALTWEFGGAVSWVDVRLTAAGDGTRLRLEHVALVEDLTMWEQFGPGAVGIGWDLSLLGLAEHLRTGAAADGDTAAGPDFLAGSSAAWCAADIAFGTPEAGARAAAAASLAFYTGGEDPAGS